LGGSTRGGANVIIVGGNSWKTSCCCGTVCVCPEAASVADCEGCCAGVVGCIVGAIGGGGDICRGGAYATYGCGDVFPGAGGEAVPESAVAKCVGWKPW